MVIMMRNPKDVLVSFYKFYTANPGYVKYSGTWDEFFQIFKAQQLFGGDWFEHTASWWDLHHHKDLLIVKYEDVQKSPHEYVQKIASHCGQALTQEKISVIAEYVMTEVPEESAMGGWKDYFTKEQNEYFDKLYSIKMGQSGLTFQYMD